MRASGKKRTSVPSDAISNISGENPPENSEYLTQFSQNDNNSYRVISKISKNDRLRINKSNLELFCHSLSDKEYRIAEQALLKTSLRDKFVEMVGVSEISQESGSLPTEAPALWADRKTGREVSPVDFIRQHYGPWLGKGLTRADLRDRDRPLYQALAKWLARHTAPDDLRDFLERAHAEPREIEAKLVELAITNPAEAYARIPDDRREADRLYQAALRRQRKRMSPT